jgi:hypothetical protein
MLRQTRSSLSTISFLLARFFRDQRWGDADPFAGGLPPELPSWCSQI